MGVDPATLERALARLPDSEALAIAAALEPPWRVRQRRLDMRDELVRRELGQAVSANLTARATELERRLRRAASTPAIQDDAAKRILDLTNGRTIGWKHLVRIARAQQSRGGA